VFSLTLWCQWWVFSKTGKKHRWVITWRCQGYCWVNDTSALWLNGVINTTQFSLSGVNDTANLTLQYQDYHLAFRRSQFVWLSGVSNPIEFLFCNANSTAKFDWAVGVNNTALSYSAVSSAIWTVTILVNWSPFVKKKLRVWISDQSTRVPKYCDSLHT
jgi:hypothetical protein